MIYFLDWVATHYVISLVALLVVCSTLTAIFSPRGGKS